jgi:hypothetical protein
MKYLGHRKGEFNDPKKTSVYLGLSKARLQTRREEWKMRVFYVVLGVALIFAAVLPGPAQAGLLNAGFEDTDTDGNPSGANWFTNGVPGGSFLIKGSHLGASGTTYTPPEGSYFLELKTDGTNAPKYAFQTATFGAGEWVAGVAAFSAGDTGTGFPGPIGSPGNDWASVEIVPGANPAGPGVTVWFSDVATVGPLGDGPWTHWQYQIPTAGTYVVKYNVTNDGDNILNSWGLFDTDDPTPVVPEAGTLVLFGLGLLTLGYSRRRGK